MRAPGTLAGDGVARPAFDGIFGLVIAATVWNFFAAISPLYCMIMLIAGWLFCVRYRAWTRIGANRLATYVVGLLIAVALSLSVVASPVSYDTGLYHLQAVLWSGDGPVAWGLANLHGRFGFNSLWFPWAASLGLPGLGLAPVFSANALIAFCLVVGLLEGVVGGRNDPHRGVSRLYAFSILLMLSLSRGLMIGLLAGPSNDFPAVATSFYCVLQALRALESGGPGLALASLRLAVLAIFVKVSALPIVLFPLIAGALRDTLTHRKWLLILIAAGVFWCLRGFLQSGCAVYPLPASCISSFSWSVPIDAVSEMQRVIEAWAKAPGAPISDALVGWGWLPKWWRTFLEQRLIWAVAAYLAAGLALASAARFFRRSSRGLDSRALGRGLAANVFGLGFWFLKGPDVRFGLAPLVLMGVLVFIWGWAFWVREPLVYLVRLRWALALPATCFVGLVGYNARNLNVSDLFQNHPRLETPALMTAPTASGLLVQIPQEGERCWDSPRPCTPYLSAYLTKEEWGLWSIWRVTPR